MGKFLSTILEKLSQTQEEKLLILSKHTSSESASRETRNSSQLSLVDRGVYTSQGTQMTLVGVDLGNECIQEVATMLDARSSGAFLNRRRSSSSSQGPTADDSLYVDIHTDSYKAFGQDVRVRILHRAFTANRPKVAYMGGKAFTRRMFKRDVQTGSFSFLNPWQGQVSMQNQNHVHDTIKSFHTPSGNNFGGSLVSELRCNFSSVPKSAHQLEVYDRRHSLQSETVRKITRGLPRKGLDSLHSSTSHRWSATSLSSGILQQPSVPYPGMELAQERLGGGRGDEAKLAKLILYPGGHDFIDLLVAANLLVFNRIYEHAMQRL